MVRTNFIISLNQNHLGGQLVMISKALLQAIFQWRELR
jgi:hypothetical protein